MVQHYRGEDILKANIYKYLMNSTTLRGFSCHGTSVAPDKQTCNSVQLVENKGVSMKTLHGPTGLSGLLELSDKRLDAFTIINSFWTVNDGKKTHTTNLNSGLCYARCYSTHSTIPKIHSYHCSDIFYLYILFTALVYRVLAFYVPVSGCLFWL